MSRPRADASRKRSQSVSNTNATTIKIRHDQTKIPCLLISVVCDIRGFTDLTARVDDYFQSRLVTSSRVKEIIEAYSTYMKETQDIAITAILQPLFDLNLNPVPRFAAKSTGDGFLIAVEVENTENKLPIVPEEKFNERWGEIAHYLAIGLTNLIKDAKPSPGDCDFGRKTHQFITKYGRDIGFVLPLPDNPKFRVAGAMAMGFGSLANRSANPEAGEPLDDAFGHPVNLAFRLCDRAGREKEAAPEKCSDKKCSPYILVDRRVARLLMALVPKRGTRSLWEINPHNHQDLLRGIEETWCFGLEGFGE